MLIHLIGAEPMIDYDHYTRSIVLRTASRPGLDAKVSEFFLDSKGTSTSNFAIPPTVEVLAKGFEPTTVAMTRLAPMRTDRKFLVFRAPLVRDLRVESFFWVMVTVQPKPHGGAFLFVSKWDETKKYQFLLDNRRPSGGVALIHNSFSWGHYDPIDGEKAVVPPRNPLWRRLREI